MARPRKADMPGLAQAHDLTAGIIDRLACPPDKTQAFLRDTQSPGLRVRVTPSGAKSYVFEAKLNRQTIRRTIGDVRTWSIEGARKEANRLRVELDRGEDPREVEKAKAADKATRLAKTAAQAVTVGDLWPTYLAEGKPKRRDEWKPRYLVDLQNMASAGCEKKKRGAGLTRPDPLLPLLALPLVAVNEDTLKAWHDKEARTSKHQAAQVAGWWSGVEQLGNRTASVYLRALLLTGARREEMAALKWADVDLRWRKLTIADKVDALRPFLAQIEAHVLMLAGVQFDAQAEPGRLQLVAG